MSGDHITKEDFMLEFDTSHVEKIVDALLHLQLFRESSGVFVLDDVSAFKPAGKIHRHEPAGDMTRESEGASDRPENHLAKPSRFCFE